MARRKTTRKPARKRSGTKSGSSSLARIGWLAAAALGIGWAATDGRALTYIETARSSVEKTLAAAETSLGNRTTPAETRQPRAQRTVERPAPERTRMPPMRAAKPVPAAQPTRMAAVAPSPAPRLRPMRMPRDAAGQQTSTARPAAAIEPPTISPATAAAVATGGERHATRRLDVHANPADGARVLAIIDTGTSVRVMKNEGRWRYVKSTASRAEGWVDGGYLAGESAASSPRALTPVAFRSIEPPPVPRLLITAPMPPMSVDTTRR